MEWSSHKLHWIIPVLNDLPIRFFDALITGGLPLVPRGLLPFIDSLGVPDSFSIPYGPLDIVDPKNFIESANAQFNHYGSAGVEERHKFALKYFHVDVIIEKIIAASHKLYDIK